MEKSLESEKEIVAQEFLELTERLKDAAGDLRRYLGQLENPVGSRNFTDAEINSGKFLHEIIEVDIDRSLDEIAELSKKRRDWKEKHIKQNT